MGILRDKTPIKARIKAPIKRIKPFWALIIKFTLVLLIPSAFITASYASEESSDAAYAEQGTTTCLECHDETEEQPVLSIFHTAHGVLGDKNSPLGDIKGCESCHGPSAAHADRPRSAPGINFGPNWFSDADSRSEVCLSCHSGTSRMHWSDSAHQLEDLSCNDCHQSHVNSDPILASSQQANLCFDCHKTQQVKANLPSRHPIKEGKTVCSDCHNPHGSSTPADLIQPSLNETCISCHKEKRGPFIFEHPPAAEDCSECHEAHGSVQDALLKSRPPFLCQQCHMANFHPSQLNDGSGLLSSGRPNQNMLGKSCLNCHAQIHGSNHPSGGRLTR